GSLRLGRCYWLYCSATAVVLQLKRREDYQQHPTLPRRGARESLFFTLRTLHVVEAFSIGLARRLHHHGHIRLPHAHAEGVKDAKGERPEIAAPRSPLLRGCTRRCCLQETDCEHPGYSFAISRDTTGLASIPSSWPLYCSAEGNTRVAWKTD